MIIIIVAKYKAVLWKKKNNEESKNSNLWNRVAQHTKIFLLKKTMKIIF